MGAASAPGHYAPSLEPGETRSALLPALKPIVRNLHPQTWWLRTGRKRQKRGISGICRGVLGEAEAPFRTAVQGRPPCPTVQLHPQHECEGQSIYFENKSELKWCLPKEGAGLTWLGAEGVGLRVARDWDGKFCGCGFCRCTNGETEAGPELGRPVPVAAEKTVFNPGILGPRASRAKGTSPSRGGKCSVSSQQARAPGRQEKAKACSAA